MKLNTCKCGCQTPENKSQKNAFGKKLYFIECPKCGSHTQSHYGVFKQRAAKEWNKGV